MIVILLLNVALPASILATLFVSVKKPNVVLAKSYCNLLYPATLPNANPLVASLLIVELNVAAPVDAIVKAVQLPLTLKYKALDNAKILDCVVPLTLNSIWL